MNVLLVNSLLLAVLNMSSMMVLLLKMLLLKMLLVLLLVLLLFWVVVAVVGMVRTCRFVLQVVRLCVLLVRACITDIVLNNRGMTLYKVETIRCRCLVWRCFSTENGVSHICALS